MTPRRVDRSLLPRTFSSWFGRFTALTEIQRNAIPPIMQGRDVLICSATASGKTEAYAAPAAEIALAHGADSAAVVIVSPTRALANDLKRRLEGPMSLVGLSFGRYTGEHKELVEGTLPTVVVTTPEALDSLLARRPTTLAATRIVVIDEIHVLDNTPLGDQLRVLLHRLERVAARRPQRAAASATVDRPDELAARYLREPVVVTVPGIRKIRYRAFEGAEVADVARHLDDLAGFGFKKILAFCRSRNQVETYASKLPKRTLFEDRVFAHHGSLARTLRERTERLFHQAPSAVCFATLTLEMGIDIGTVDYVLLIGVPSDVASVLQRIGRGGRRGETTRCGYVARNAAEHHLFTTMLRLGRAGRLCGSPYGFRPGILVQQALVLASANTWIELPDLEAAIPPEVLSGVDPGGCGAVLDAMVDVDHLERRGRGRFVVSGAIERRYDRGVLHSNIDDEAGIDVVDRLTGDVIGTIQSAESRRIEIGGSEREVVKIGDERILTDRGKDAQPAYFRPSGSPVVSLALGRAVVEALGVSAGAVELVSIDATWILLHGLGTAGSVFLVQLVGEAMGSRAIEDSSPYTLKLTTAPKDLPRPDDETVDRFVRERLNGLEKLTSPGPWRKVPPQSHRLAATTQIVGISEVAAFLRGARLDTREQPSDDLRQILRDL